jgi:hypothetical protein
MLGTRSESSASTPRTHARARSGPHLNARTHTHERTRMQAVLTRPRAESDRDGDRETVWPRTNARAHTQLYAAGPRAHAGIRACVVHRAYHCQRTWPAGRPHRSATHPGDRPPATHPVLKHTCAADVELDPVARMALARRCPGTGPEPALARHWPGCAITHSVQPTWSSTRWRGWPRSRRPSSARHRRRRRRLKCAQDCPAQRGGVAGPRTHARTDARPCCRQVGVLDSELFASEAPTANGGGTKRRCVRRRIHLPSMAAVHRGSCATAWASSPVPWPVVPCRAGARIGRCRYRPPHPRRKWRKLRPRRSRRWRRRRWRWRQR